MNDFIKKSATISVSIFSILIAIIPEEIFNKFSIINLLTREYNIILNRALFFVIVWIVSAVIYSLLVSIKWWRTIGGKNYKIVVIYKDMFKMKNCKKVIPFDECFTTNVGTSPGDIKPTSICGQFLQKNQIDIMRLMDEIHLTSKGRSKYKGKDKYESGRLIPFHDFFLMSFAKLDKDGLGRMTRDELTDCLSILWREIDKYYGQHDVCIPILGSGITRLDDTSLGQQELLDILITSYKLSASKMKKPNKLYIVCRRSDDFSLNRIGKYI